jgi:integral membrane sensor domain MASE1
LSSVVMTLITDIVITMHIHSYSDVTYVDIPMWMALVITMFDTSLSLCITTVITMFAYRDNDVLYNRYTMFTGIVITMVHDSVITTHRHRYNDNIVQWYNECHVSL